MKKKNIVITVFVYTLLLFTSINALAQADESYLRNIRDEFKIKWPNNRTINLVFHGHSVPTGYYTAGNVYKLGAYPHYTLEQIKGKYPYAVVNSITTSIGGEQAERGETRFANEVLTMRPDVLFIDYALNDRGIGLDRAKTAWQKMIDAALAHTFTDRDGNVHGVKVFLLTPTPDTNEDILSDETPLAQHAAQIRQLAIDNNVGLIDSYAIFKELVENGESLSPYMAQNNHVNATGHHLVANKIAELFLMNDEIVSSLTPQTITDFETPISVTTAGGAAFEVVENPLKSGINQTDNCGQIKRTSTLWWELLDIPCDFSIPSNEVAYLHVMAKYPAKPDVVVRPNQMGNEINLRPTQEYTEIGEWQDLVFVIEGGSLGLAVNNIRFISDNSPTGDFVLDNVDKFGFIDEIIVNNNPEPRTTVATTTAEIDVKKKYLITTNNSGTIKFEPLSDEMSRVVLYDINGKVLYSDNSNGFSYQVPRAGIYIVKVDNSTEKVIVM
ncbi:SGNH/GDSL hydrolase family protein [Carboxylicivirga sp. M1479]|uniref:SGNH/GDSL hydrolase family protein n=1 Tax=Carboxylicivirga sp. M1479 TaxID=2594476 RepID=UPI00117743FF|nr:SGNH/GDSL hydrolase family protein [Carboxylicivirga sp. M1479]TRX71152.1 T9SS type A sorting domain-containing protein [Carboxylicivirga sp. M1479]